MNPTVMDRIWYWLKLVVVAVMLVFIIRGFLLIPMTVDGISMEPTLQADDHIVYEKISSINRFDVVIFQMPNGNTYIKRVIGLPNEKIAYKNDKLYVDGKEVAEPFLGKQKIKRTSTHYTTNFDSEEILEQPAISENAYFVLGDNRRLSKDSRSFGEVDAKYVVGKARFIYYPLFHIKWL